MVGVGQLAPDDADVRHLAQFQHPRHRVRLSHRGVVVEEQQVLAGRRRTTGVDGLREVERGRVVDDVLQGVPAVQVDVHVRDHAGRHDDDLERGGRLLLHQGAHGVVDEAARARHVRGADGGDDDRDDGVVVDPGMDLVEPPHGAGCDGPAPEGALEVLLLNPSGGILSPRLRVDRQCGRLTPCPPVVQRPGQVDDLREARQQPQGEVEVLRPVHLRAQPADLPHVRAAEDREVAQVHLRQEELGREVGLAVELEVLAAEVDLVLVRVHGVREAVVLDGLGELVDAPRIERVVVVEHPDVLARRLLERRIERRRDAAVLLVHDHDARIAVVDPGELVQVRGHVGLARAVVDHDELPVPGALRDDRLQALAQELHGRVVDRHEDRHDGQVADRSRVDVGRLCQPGLVLPADVALVHLAADPPLDASGPPLRTDEGVRLGDHRPAQSKVMSTGSCTSPWPISPRGLRTANSTASFHESSRREPV